MLQKKSFFNRQSTAVTLLINGTSIDEMERLARAGEADGADGIAIEIGQLPPEERTEENFARLINAVHLPFMFILYRNDKWGLGDDERQQYLLAAARAGAEVIDVMGDLYAPAEYELATDPAAIEKQKALIREIHEIGAKVIMSSHIYTQARTAEEVLAHLKEQSSRGADILKLVITVNTEEEFQEVIRTAMILNKEIEKPFVFLSGGKYGRIHRFLGTLMGNSITFAVHDYTPPSPPFSQPTIKAFKNVMNNIHWHLDDVQDKS